MKAVPRGLVARAALVLLACTLTTAAQAGPLIHGPVATIPSGLLARLLVVGGAALLGWLMGLAVVARDERRALIVIVAVAAATRFAVPDAFLQSDADDLRLAALARGIELTGIGGTANPSPALLALLRTFMPWCGSDIAAVMLPVRAAGTLLPIIGFLVATRWFAQREPARVVAALLLLSPLACAFSATICAEMPAAALYAAAMLFGLLAVERDGLWRLCIAPAAMCLYFATALKEELAALLVALPLVLGWRARHGTRVGAGLALAALPTLFALALRLRSADADTSSLAGWRLHVLTPSHVFFYVLATALFNPPFLPAKWGLWQSRGSFRETWPWFVHFALFWAIFSSAYSLVGFNQWRYAVSSLLPIAILLAPVVLAARTASPRWLAGFVAVELLVELGGYLSQVYRPLAGDLAALQAASAPALVAYAPYHQDRDPGVAVVLAGRSAAISLAELWPEACAPAVEQRRLGLLSDYLDLARKHGLDPVRFRSLERLDADRAWLGGQPVQSWWKAPSTGREPVVDAAACGAALPAWTAALARFRSLGLLVDAQYVEEHGWKHRFQVWRGAAVTARSEHLDRAARWLALGDPIRKDGGIVRIMAIRNPLDPAAVPVWSER